MAFYERTDTPGKFRVRTSMGSGPTRRTKAATLHATTRTIEHVMADWEAAVHAEWRDDDAGPGDSLDAVWREYIAANPRWSESHRAGHEYNRHQVALDGLGERSIRDVRRVDIAEHLARWRATPKSNGDMRSTRSIEDRLKAIRSVMLYAVDEGHIDRDPTRKLEVPKGRFIEERDIPTLADLDARVTAACARLDELPRPNPARSELLPGIARSALLTGMRREEVLGLRHGDVTIADEDGSLVVTIRVRRAVAPGPARLGGYILKETKNDRRRTIAVPAEVGIIILEREMSRTLDLDVADAHADAPPLARAFVFSDTWGIEPLKPSRVYSWWRTLTQLEPALSEVQFKDMRTSHSTGLNHSGLHRKAVAAHMGHGQAVNEEHYDQIRPGDAAAIRAALEEQIRFRDF
jgi:integrase